MELKISATRKDWLDSNAHVRFSLQVPDMTYRTGELVFLMGPNGSGKSLYLRLISGELPSTGQGVYFEWEGTRRQAGLLTAAIVRQEADLSLAPSLSVRDNLVIRRRAPGWMAYLCPARFHEDAVKEVLRDYPEILRNVDGTCSTLSLGQRQTLALLAALSQQLSILLLDEFLASADAETSRALLAVVRNYTTDHPAASVIVSHDSGLAAREADRIVVLRNGKVVFDEMRSNHKWSANSIDELISGRAV